MSAGRRAASLARRAVVAEIGIWVSLYRWLVRRPRAPGGSRTFSYARLVTPTIWLFIAMSAIEVPVLHVLLPWHSAQVLSFVVGSWGLLWMLGLLAGLHVHPHVVGPAGLRVRYGHAVDVVVPWTDIASVSSRSRDHHGSRTIRLEDSEAGQVLVLAIGSQTTVDVRLHEPLTVRLPAGAQEVVELRVHADDPRGLVAGIRGHLGTSGAPRTR